jgi:YjbE family integral membrane protein
VLEFLAALGGIVLVDLVLSGDNALVIGAAAAGLPRRQRYIAMGAGGAAAIVLRIVFASAATLLLQLPLLQALGGLVLLVIAARLLAEREGPEQAEIAEEAELVPHTAADGEAAHARRAPGNRSFLSALLTIMVADVTMSLDNILAVGALAAGNIGLLAAGLLLSITLVLVGSALVAELIGRLPWLLDVAALVLGWTSANMILDDLRLGPVLERASWTSWAIPAACIAVVAAADIYFRRRQRRARASKETRKPPVQNR